MWSLDCRENYDSQAVDSLLREECDTGSQLMAEWRVGHVWSLYCRENYDSYSVDSWLREECDTCGHCIAKRIMTNMQLIVG